MRLEVGLPDVPLGSDANRWALANGVLSYGQSDHFCVTILLDGARMGRIADARPRLPLVLKW